MTAPLRPCPFYTKTTLVIQIKVLRDFFISLESQMYIGGAHGFVDGTFGLMEYKSLKKEYARIDYFCMAL